MKTKVEKAQLIEDLAQKWADDMDMGALMEFYIDHQVEFLEDQCDADLLEYAENSDLIDNSDDVELI